MSITFNQKHSIQLNSIYLYHPNYKGSSEGFTVRTQATSSVPGPSHQYRKHSPNSPFNGEETGRNLRERPRRTPLWGQYNRCHVRRMSNVKYLQYIGCLCHKVSYNKCAASTATTALHTCLKNENIIIRRVYCKDISRYLNDE